MQRPGGWRVPGMREAAAAGREEGAGCGQGHAGCRGEDLGFTPREAGAVRSWAEEALVRSRF